MVITVYAVIVLRTYFASFKTVNNILLLDRVCQGKGYIEAMLLELLKLDISSIKHDPFRSPIDRKLAL